MQNDTTNNATVISEKPRRGRAGIRPGRNRSGAGAQAGVDEICSLGSLEAEMMSILWEMGRPVSSMEVMEFSLYQRRSRGQEPAGFATIATTLRRLSDKGIVSAERNEQRTPRYCPMIQREEMAARVLNNVTVTLLGQPLYYLLPELSGKTSSKKPTSQDIELQQRLISALEAATND